MKHSDRSSGLQGLIHATVHHPIRLRVALAATLLMVWYLALYGPLTGKIAVEAGHLATERERLELVKGIDQLAREEGRYLARLSKGGRNAWVQFLVDGIGQRSLKLISLDPQPPATVGPYRAEVVTVVVEGTFRDLEGFLRWLETNPRLVRIDKIDLGSSRGKLVGKGQSADGYKMQLVVMGVLG